MRTLENGEKSLKNLRESNIALIINLMRKLGTCSRAELSKASGLVQSTITSIIDSLIKSGVVIETGSLTGGRGRRSIAIQLNAEKLIVLGIRVTKNFYTLSLIDIFGEVQEIEKHPIAQRLEDPRVFEDILQTSSEFLDKAEHKPVGVGLALPGPYFINEDNSLFLTDEGWKKFSFTRKFEDRLHLPVFIEQDSNVGAMGEWWFGNSEIEQGTKVFISSGDGVGAGIVVDGKIQRGALGAAGEIGHMSINFEGPQCQCGNKGCLELYCSEQAILAGTESLPHAIHDFDELAEEYRAGNPAVVVMSEKKIWVETIIDAFDLETTKEIAKKAVEYGSDWISVGTNNMYACGFMHSIPAVKEIAGDIPVVADIKIHDGGNGFSAQARKCGADYSVVSTRFNYGCARQAMVAYANTGIKIIGDLCTVPVEEIPHYVAELQNIGIHAVRVHQTYDELKYRYMFSRSWDGVKEAKGVATIPVGCVVRTKEDIVHALADGADYICLAGDVVNKAPEQGYETLKEYIDFVHSYQRGCGTAASGGYGGYQAE